MIISEGHVANKSANKENYPSGSTRDIPVQLPTAMTTPTEMPSFTNGRLMIDGYVMGRSPRKDASPTKSSSAHTAPQELDLPINGHLNLREQSQRVLATAKRFLSMTKTLQFASRIAFWLIAVLLVLALLGRLFTRGLTAIYQHCLADNGSFCVWTVMRAFFSADNLVQSPRISLKLSNSGLPNATALYEAGFPVAHDNTILLMATFTIIIALRFFLDSYHKFLIATTEIVAAAAGIPIARRPVPPPPKSNLFPSWLR
jgi:hypothetical protein